MTKVRGNRESPLEIWAPDEEQDLTELKREFICIFFKKDMCVVRALDGTSIDLHLEIFRQMDSQPPDILFQCSHSCTRGRGSFGDTQHLEVLQPVLGNSSHPRLRAREHTTEDVDPPMSSPRLFSVAACLWSMVNSLHGSAGEPPCVVQGCQTKLVYGCLCFTSC